MKIGIVGGGLTGSLLAWRASASGAEVELFDRDKSTCCSLVGAGMLGISAETAIGGEQIGQIGMRSLQLWRNWLSELKLSELLFEKGTLLVAVSRDLPELDRTAELIAANQNQQAQPTKLDRAALAEIEPQLSHLPRGYLLPADAHLNAEAVLEGLRHAAYKAGTKWNDNCHVDSVEPGKLAIGDKNHSYDWVCDCRGMGAAKNSQLRPVRGEILHLQSNEVSLSRPVRLIHPRYPVYIVPREPGYYLVGATEIETESTEPVTVRSVLELLSAAYAVQPAFAEASVVDMRVGHRPAYRDNMPALKTEPGLISVNGLYRHGYLTAPALVAQATEQMGLN